MQRLSIVHHVLVAAFVAASGCEQDSSDDDAGDDVPGVDTGERGQPGCGLDSAAFCDSFDAPSTQPGRAGELDSSRWSLSRIEPELGTRFEIGPATVPACRADVPSQVSPPHDTLICSPNPAIASSHLMVAVAAQTYGTNSYRIRQPFDFEGRTGTVVFDADATTRGPLFGWISVEVIEEPMNAPSFSSIPGAGNFEGGVIPQNGIEIQIAGNCGDGQDSARVLAIHEFRDSVDHVHEASLDAPCFDTSRDHLDRFRLELSQSHLELWATAVSPDGVTFEAARLVASADLDLAFARGYVSITTHNHATLKYSDDAIDAWVTRWDNVGFDGPVIAGLHELEAPDSMVAGPGGVGIGYFVHDAAAGEVGTVTIPGATDIAAATRARLSFNALYMKNQFGTADFSTYGLRYRINGGAWHDQPMTDTEKALLEDGVALAGDLAGSENSIIIGTLGHVFEVPVAELEDGDNRLDIATVGVPVHGYLSTIANVDLILERP